MSTNQNIFEAIEQNDIERVKQLLENGTNPNIQGDLNYAPLLYACIANDVNIVQLLLEYGANPNIQNPFGRTPLRRASINNQHDIIMLLIDYGADCNLIDSNGKTAFDFKGGEFIKEYLESKEHQIILK